ncbi:MAG TPA: DNA-formamidopyrimidine glycosylase family protein [Burkholderiales bacterium]
MPEGPEIRRFTDALAQVLGRSRVRDIRFAFARLQRHAAALTGQRIVAVEARGKAMLIRFSGGLTLYSHNQLYGEWIVYPGTPPQTHLQQRILIRTARGCAVLYSATEIELLDEPALARHRYLLRLGPDVLEAATTLAIVRARLQSPAFARRRLAALLLEQGFLAGLGNYLRSEILFAAPAPRPAPDRPSPRASPHPRLAHPHHQPPRLPHRRRHQ